MRLYDLDATRNSLERAVKANLDTETMIIMVDGDHERMVELEAELCISRRKRTRPLDRPAVVGTPVRLLPSTARTGTPSDLVHGRRSLRLRAH